MLSECIFISLIFCRIKSKDFATVNSQYKDVQLTYITDNVQDMGKLYSVQGLSLITLHPLQGQALAYGGKPDSTI